jgi:hypothetical protein
MRKPAILLKSLFAAILALTACNSSAPPPVAKTVQPPQYLSGREAFQELYVAAHSLAGDVKPYHLGSTYTKGSPALEGKSALWRADFASPSKKLSKSFSWSGLTGPDAPESGVSHGPDDTYNPANTSTSVFDTQFLKVDSDQAFKIAQQHGGEKLTNADPSQPVFFTLDFDPRQSQLIWRVVYGSSQYDAKLNVMIDATSGHFLREEK